MQHVVRVLRLSDRFKLTSIALGTFLVGLAALVFSSRAVAGKHIRYVTKICPDSNLRGYTTAIRLA